VVSGGVVIGLGLVVGSGVVVTAGADIKVTGASVSKTPAVKNIASDNCVLMPVQEVTTFSPIDVLPHPYW
jgi:hypothetical protein